jgi:hypothetical protein
LNFGAWILTRSGWEFFCVRMDASEEEEKEEKVWERDFKD